MGSGAFVACARSCFRGYLRGTVRWWASTSRRPQRCRLHRGVDLVVQPAGKRVRSVQQLSGGERALTAIALRFALLELDPLPFCVLDEVDAALDEANVARFRGVLERLAERTQFLVITHNRVTIEAAGTLYGVTMGEDGVSRVVSLRLADYACG